MLVMMGKYVEKRETLSLDHVGRSRVSPLQQTQGRCCGDGSVDKVLATLAWRPRLGFSASMQKA